MTNDKKENLHFLWGANLIVLLKTLQQQRIERPYIGTFLKGVAFSLFNTPMKLHERWKYNKIADAVKIEKQPIFIIGHWRSGTTHLHNMMSTAPNIAYLSTLHALYPEALMHEPLRNNLRKMVEQAMPENYTRVQDNVKVGIDEPQEEEFSLGNINGYSYYFSIYFPQKMREYYHRYLTFETCPAKELAIWQRDYIRLIKKAIYLTGGSTFLSKNPPNMGRIPQLLAMFPQAKFVYIYRNPIVVYLSMSNLMRTLMNEQKLQNISPEEVQNNILYVYRELVQKYESDKSLIPKGNLVELKFEDLESDPLAQLHRIYTQLDLPEYDQARPFFERYCERVSDYQKNSYSIAQTQLDKVLKEWGFAMQQYGYDLPIDLKITTQ